MEWTYRIDKKDNNKVTFINASTEQEIDINIIHNLATKKDGRE